MPNIATTTHPTASPKEPMRLIAIMIAVAMIAGCAEQKNSAPVSHASPASHSSSTSQPSPAPAPSPEAPVVSDTDDAPQASAASDYPMPDESAVEPAIFEQLQSAREAAMAQPNDPAVIGRLAMLYHAYGMLPAAQSAYVRALELQPDTFRWHYLLGHVLLRQNAFDEAIAHLSRAVELKPDYLTARIILANAYAGSGDLRKALEIAVAMYDANPNNPVVTYELGSYYLAANEPVWAVQYLKPVLDASPEYGGVRVALAEAFGRMGQQKRANELLEKAGSDRSTPPVRDPELLAIYRLATGTTAERNKAIANLSRGHLEQAIVHFEKALSFSPQDREARIGLADALAAHGDLDRAEAILSGMVSEDDTDTAALVRLATLYFRQDKIADARPLIEHAAKRIPEDVVVLGLEAKLAVFDNEFAEAVSLLERVVLLRPDDGQAFFELAKAYAMTLQLRDAEEALRHTLDLMPDFQEAKKALGDIYYALGEQDSAMAWYRRAAKQGALLPPTAMAAIAEDALSDGEYAVGLDILRRSVDAYPDDENLRDTLSRTLSMCPDPKIRNGVEAMRIARDLYGDDMSQIPIRGLVTLAAAHGELGEYKQAVDICAEGMQRALESQEPKTYHHLQQLLRRYENLQQTNEPNP